MAKQIVQVRRQGSCNLDEIDTQDRDENHDPLGINFKLEKVCWSCEFPDSY